jgi:hypothetical protein
MTATLSSNMKLVQMEVDDRTLAYQLPYIEDPLAALFLPGNQIEPLPERDRLLFAMANIDADTRAQVARIARAKDVPGAALWLARRQRSMSTYSSTSRALTLAVGRAAAQILAPQNKALRMSTVFPSLAFQLWNIALGFRIAETEVPNEAPCIRNL